MHPVENIDIHNRCYRGQARETIATGFYTVLRGVGGPKRERHIAVVWLYSASESRISISITFLEVRVGVRVINKPSSSVMNLTPCVCAAISENKLNAMSGT